MLKISLIFIAEFVSCLRSLPVSCSYQCAKLKAVIAARKAQIEKAEKQGSVAYLCDKSIADNPYLTGEMFIAWRNGYMAEKKQWEPLITLLGARNE
jgi:hypothetical protein